MRKGAKKQFARKLRRSMTDAERCLWRHLRLRQIDGHRFRRQHPVGPYIADFACIEARLILEMDGGQHLESPADAKRDEWFAMQQYRILHFWNHDVLNRTEQVLAVIFDALASRDCPHPSPPPQAGERDGFAAPLDNESGLHPRAEAGGEA